MAYNYDELYRSTPDALGEPTKIIVEFFKRLDREGLRVLDVGCGQGRDALFIARDGHQVVAVDISPNGIGDLRKAAASGGLSIEAVVADIVSFKPVGEFDVILIDRTLHMLPDADRLEVLDRLLAHVAANGYILIADEKSNVPPMKKVILQRSEAWISVLEKGGYLFLHRT